MSGFAVHRAVTAIREALAKAYEEDGVIVTDWSAEIPAENASLEDALRAVVRKVQEANAMAEAVKLQRDALAVREGRFVARAKVLREVLFNAVEMLPGQKIELPEATLGIRQGTPSVVVTEIEALPEKFIVYPDPVPNKTLIAAELKAGHEIPGAHLSNGAPSLSLRSN